jgi:hypothetical protein
MFERRSSEHEHDYWIVSSTATCLSSESVYTVARFDVDSGTLQFTPRATSRMHGPWKLFLSPLKPGRGQRKNFDGLFHTSRTGMAAANKARLTGKRMD